MADKTKERAVLRMIYDETDFHSISESEVPDFIIRSQGPTGYVFGVEVTDAYHSESSARLMNLPGYVTHLLQGGEYKHKDDRQRLTVDKVTITGPDGEFKGKVPAIIQDSPSLEGHIATLIDRIEAKASRYSKLETELGHVNLIISDAERRFLLADPEDVHRHFFTEELRTSVLHSPFREIFLISEIKEERIVFFPLKAVSLIAYVFFFVEVLNSRDAAPDVTSSGDLWLSFARFMHGQSLRVALLGPCDAPTEVLFGASGLVLSTDQGLIVHDYRDSVLPSGWFLQSPVEGLELSAAFQQCFREVVAGSAFVTNLATDVRSSGSIT
ncbi:MAG: hypothetical protein ACYSVY_01105 [Planctomycetota bacterium]|jgi:hypothetical protein